jgi:hypothetical protein
MDYLHPTWRTWSFLIVLLGPSGLPDPAFFHCRRLKRNRLDRERLPIEPPSYGIGCHRWSGKLTLSSYSKESLKRTSTILHLEHRSVKTIQMRCEDHSVTKLQNCTSNRVLNRMSIRMLTTLSEPSVNRTTSKKNAVPISTVVQNCMSNHMSTTLSEPSINQTPSENNAVPCVRWCGLALSRDVKPAGDGCG